MDTPHVNIEIREYDMCDWSVGEPSSCMVVDRPPEDEMKLFVRTNNGYTMQEPETHVRAKVGIYPYIVNNKLVKDLETLKELLADDDQMADLIDKEVAEGRDVVILVGPEGVGIYSTRIT